VNPRISRREWLLLGAGFAFAQTDVTPADESFVRDHFGEPQLSLATWKLRLEGHVARPFDVTFSDLLESPATRVESVLECAGNSPAGNGVSAGVWQGVWMANLLDQAGADPSGPVLLEGADEGQLLAGGARTAYLRVVPQSKCRAAGSIVAFKLNDRFLPRSRGFPARAVLPGWYGMDSVKWLRRIVVLGRGETPPYYDESGMSGLYCRLRNHAPPDRISRILVKSMIAYPRDGARLPAAGCIVRGYAWTGEGAVKRVEVSVDGGKVWSAARLEPPAQPFAWARWTWSWQAGPGEHVLLSRAQDSLGNWQPLTRDPERLDSYELNWCAPVRCAVR
jgi:DMSO/TMAO reductase YedYZ molybdopterin-dependent catalytic subunit